MGRHATFDMNGGVKLPNSDGQANQALTTNGEGALGFSAVKLPTSADSSNEGKNIVLGANGQLEYHSVKIMDQLPVEGQILRSDGSKMVPGLVLPNVPPAAGTVLQSNGTSVGASSYKLPTTVGTNGQILKSDGTNIVFGDNNSIPGLVAPEGTGSVGSVWNHSDRGQGNGAGAWTSSGPWTTYYQYLGDNTSLTQAMCMALGTPYGTSHSSQGATNFSGSAHKPSRYVMFAGTNNALGQSFTRTYGYSPNNTASYGPVTWQIIPLRNTTASGITATLYWNFSSYWNNGYEGSGIAVITPNSNKYSNTTSTTHSFPYTSTSNANGTTTSVNITIPANTTILVMLANTSYYWSYYTTNTGQTWNDVNWVYNLSSLLPSGVICDMRMLSTLYSSKLDLGYTTANFAGIWKACARDFGDR